LGLHAKQIKDFPNYFIFNDGRVYSKSRIIHRKIKGLFKIQGKFLKLRKSGRDKNKGDFYHSVLLYDKNIKKECSIHRLLAQAFIPNPENKSCVNHKNGIKTDNQIKNLEWVSQSENHIHAYQILNIKKNCKEINQIKNNFIVKKYPSIITASKELNLSIGGISKCCHNKIKFYKGFQWEFAKKDNL
jgi:hypothetical protein